MSTSASGHRLYARESAIGSSVGGRDIDRLGDSGGPSGSRGNGCLSSGGEGCPATAGGYFEGD